MIGLFVLGGVCGVTGASAALVMGASLPKAVLVYMGVGMILPVTGIISMAFRNEVTDLVPAGATDSFSDTMSQWNADPESGVNSQQFGFSHDKDDDQQGKVA